MMKQIDKEMIEPMPTADAQDVAKEHHCESIAASSCMKSVVPPPFEPVLQAVARELRAAIEALKHAPRAAADALDDAEVTIGLAYWDRRSDSADVDERSMLRCLDDMFLPTEGVARKGDAEEILIIRALAHSKPYRVAGATLGDAFWLAERAVPPAHRRFREFCEVSSYKLSGASFKYVLVCLYEYVGYVTSRLRLEDAFERDLRELITHIFLTVVESDVFTRQAFAAAVLKLTGEAAQEQANRAKRGR
ncbi:hypothetical protein [Variovorax sp. J31P207]|uniref:hypothetical protein n=1 Tax=Variovorax sp. J31P207 TaxID=3053510 RepID=UPI002578640F|nr:hypothetical protein [Variovorax sp. J31P207]MDM0071462.1 hypothetical protein [Variovorax sp. J31P207]